MKKLKNNRGITSATIIVIVYILMTFLPIIAELCEEYDINLNPNDYVKIRDLEYKAIVDDSPGSNGKLNITEWVTFDVHAASRENGFYELWRDLPEDTVDGADVRYKVKSVKQIKDDGSVIEYKEAPHVYYNDSDYESYNMSGLGPYKWFHSPGPYSEYKRQYEAVMIYIDDVYREKMTFEIEYEMYNASLRYGDCSELYISMFSDNSVYDLKHFKGEILFPEEVMPKSGNYTVDTFGTNKGSFPIEESNTKYPGYHTFTMNLNEKDLKFRPYNEYIEFSLVSFNEDKHSFTQNASINDYYYSSVLDEVKEENQYYHNLPKMYYKIKIVIFSLCIVFALYILTKPKKKLNSYKDKYNFYESSITGYYRDIPSDLDPLFASHLAFLKKPPKKPIKDGYSSILLSLTRKKYIEIVKIRNELDWKAGNTKIIIKYKPAFSNLDNFENVPKISNIPNFTTKATLDATQNTITDTLTHTDEIINNTLNQVNTHKNEVKEIKYEKLTINEQEYFNLISQLSIDNEITLSRLEEKLSTDYSKANSFVKALESSTLNIGINEKYYQTATYDEIKNKINLYKIFSIVFAIIFGIIVNIITYHTRIDLAFGGFFIIAIAFLINAIYYKTQANNYLLLTQFGEDECAKWRGLYEFLNSETLMYERTVVELPIWEKYLVYATAFGISEKVINALKFRCPDTSNSSILNESSPYRSSSFYHSTHSFHSSAYNNSSFTHTSRVGGYTSHGGFGGYGGGGRGGGGGGGGH